MLPVDSGKNIGLDNKKLNVKFKHNYVLVARVDPGILEKGFIYMKVWRVCFADLISFFLNIP